MVLIGFSAFAQTTLTVDANGVLNFTKLVAQTTGGQNFFTGHQLGSTYSLPIWREYAALAQSATAYS